MGSVLVVQEGSTRAAPVLVGANTDVDRKGSLYLGATTTVAADKAGSPARASATPRRLLVPDCWPRQECPQRRTLLAFLGRPRTT